MNATSPLVKVRKLHPDAKLPAYDYDDDAGAGIFALHRDRIPPGGRVAFETGIALELPVGWRAVAFSRSGMWRKHGIHLEAGLIDEGFRGEIVVVLQNASPESYAVRAGDKIAQLTFEPYYQARFEEVLELAGSARGEKGWGSSGR